MDNTLSTDFNFRISIDDECESIKELLTWYDQTRICYLTMKDGSIKVARLINKYAAPLYQEEYKQDIKWVMSSLFK